MDSVWTLRRFYNWTLAYWRDAGDLVAHSMQRVIT